MNAQDFCYWLQGFFEVANPQDMTAEQTQMVKDHLALVFHKVTPDMVAPRVAPRIGSPVMLPIDLSRPFCTSLPRC